MRLYRPNRLVQIPRDEEIEIAEHVLASVTAFISDLVEDGTLEFDQNLGDLVGEEGYYVEIHGQDGHRVKVIVQNPCTEKPDADLWSALSSLSKFFTSGDYAPALDRVRIYASSCRTVADGLEPNYPRSRLRDFLDVWLHEYEICQRDWRPRPGWNRCHHCARRKNLASPGPPFVMRFGIPECTS